jgi:hypothetical protein
MSVFWRRRLRFPMRSLRGRSPARWSVSASGSERLSGLASGPHEAALREQQRDRFDHAISGRNSMNAPSELPSSDPTIVALRRALDCYAAVADSGSGEGAWRERLVDLIASHLPLDFVKPILIPADRAGAQSLSVILQSGN